MGLDQDGARAVGGVGGGLVVFVLVGERGVSFNQEAHRFRIFGAGNRTPLLFFFVLRHIRVNSRVRGAGVREDG